MMTKVTNGALFFLAAGLFTSSTILSGYQVLFTIPLAYYVYLAVKNKELHFPKSAYWLMAFAAVALLSLVVNYELIPKPTKNFGRLKFFVFGFGGILVFRHWLTTASDKAKRIIMNVFCLGLIAAGVFGAYQVFYLGLPRVKGLTNTMRYGYGSGMILLTLLSAILHREKIKNWFDHRWAIAGFVVGFIGMYLTYTRGGLLGFLCGLPFVLYYYRPKLGLWFGGASAGVILLLVGFFLFGSGELGSRFLKSKDNSSDKLRWSQWQSGIIAAKEKPVLGWGLSNFHTQLKRIKIENDLFMKEYDDAHSHNLFIEIAAGTGLVGLFFFLGWLLTWAWEAFKAGGLVRAFVIPFGVSFVVSSQFEVTFDANNASMIFCLYAFSSSLLETKSTQS